MTTVRLTGLDGSNPLAFLAALGVLVALDEACSGADRPRLGWAFDGRWLPQVHSQYPDMDMLVDVLDQDRQSASAEPALRFKYNKGAKDIEDIKPPPEDLAAKLKEWVGDPSAVHRRTLDWMSAFVSEGATDRSGAAKPSALHFTAGQQKFLKAVRELQAGVSPTDLRAALEGPWPYDSKLPVMGWDNTETRDYALRAYNPSNDKKLGNPGADWLAVRGLILLPTAACRQRQQTAGVRGGWKTSTFTWPMWTPAATLDEVRSLVLARDIWEVPPSLLYRRGIERVFEVRILRSDQGGYGSVTPAQPL